MVLKNWVIAVLLLATTGAATGVGAAQDYVVPTTTLTALTANNTSAANGFLSQPDGNSGAGNVSKLDVHSLLYTGAATKVYAHLMLWFGASNHMNVGYSSTDPTQVHRQINDMISRGIDGVIIDWYGPNNSIDQATQLVMAEAEKHPGFTFAIMVDQGAIEYDSCAGCNAQQALISQLQYIEQKYFTSPAYMTIDGRPVVTNFDIDLSYTVNWTAVAAALSTQPVFLFQNNSGFSHVLSGGSFSWVMPTTTDYGMSYLTSFYGTGMPLATEETVGATYKGFNDSLASWGSGRLMAQQCSHTWLQTFNKVNGLYGHGTTLSALELVTWNDYEEGTEIESGISNCFSLTASVSGNALQWTPKGDETTVAQYVAYISTDGQNLMPLGSFAPGNDSLNLCSYSIPNGNYMLYVQAVGKPSLTNEISGPVKFNSACVAVSQTTTTKVNFGASPAALTIASGGLGHIMVSATPQTGAFNHPITLSCAGLPQNLACEFSPASITPGAGPVNSVLTLSVVSTAAQERRTRRGQPFYAVWLFSLGGAGLVFTGKQQRGRLLRILGACGLAIMILVCASCGGGKISSQAVASQRQTAATYSVTINGNSNTVQLSTTVAVTVQ